MLKKSLIIGSGSCLPDKIVTNEDFTKILETSDEWIQSRVGISSRRFLSEDETLDDIASKACEEALAIAGVKADEVDAIIVGTTTSPYIFPSMGALIQRHIGATRACAFDVQAVCSGFIYALSVADNMIKAGQFKTVLVVGAEAMSRITDQTDRGTAVIFADGAGAVVLRAVESTEPRGILSTHLYSDGTLTDLLCAKGGGGSCGPKGFIEMKGREVMRHAVAKLGQAVMTALEANNLTPADIDWFVPHQANLRIIKAVSEHFHLPQDRVILTLDHHGNTSAASIPLALDEAVKGGKIKQGQLLILEALGGGLTWGSAAVRW